MRHSLTMCFLIASTQAIAAPPQFHDQVASDDPILWYKLGEPMGAPSAANSGSLGNTHEGFVLGPILGQPTAAGDTGARFVRTSFPTLESALGAPSFMQGNPTFTAEAVVFIPSNGASTLWAPVLHWGTGGTGREVYFSLQQNRNNIFYVGFYNGGLRSVCDFRLDDWNHFVWTRDSANGTNNAYTGSRLYVNGQEIALEVDTDLPGFATVPVVGTGPFRVQRAADSTRYFDGTIDEVVLYDRLLSPAEIAAHFNALNIAGPTICKADLVAPCGVLDFFDVQRFLQLFAGQDQLADLTGDGIFDFFDVLSFLQLFSSGCQ